MKPELVGGLLKLLSTLNDHSICIVPISRLIYGGSAMREKAI